MRQLETAMAPPAMETIMMPELLEALKKVDLELAALLAPPPEITMSGWAEANLTLRKGTSSRPGPWRTESYQKEIFDVLNDPQVKVLVFRKPTQFGWSSILNAIAGYFIDADPSPILFVQPGKQDAEQYSKKRIATLIADCPALSKKIKPATSRRAGNTLLLKEFDGGFLRFAFATSAKSLRSDPIRILICDEIDGYVLDCEGEGPPIDIALRRTDSYEDAKILLGSTPAKPKGISPIDNAFLLSDQRFYWVPCQFCGFPQPLVWRDLGEFLSPNEKGKYKCFGTGAYRLRWEKDSTGAPIAGSVRYYCANCEKGIEEKYKQRMLDAGAWHARFPGLRDIEGFKKPGFAINSLYSPWKGTVWSAMAQEWHESRDNPEKQKTFINLRLGETWDEGTGERLDEHILQQRLEKYPLSPDAGDATHWQNYLVPLRCCLLVAMADVQSSGGGRIEAQIIGFGPGEESWLIAYDVFWGDAGTRVDPETGISVWAELDKFFLHEIRHESGAILRPAICLVDSGDQTDAVYEYVLPRQIPQRRVYACKGVEYLSRPDLAKEGTAKRHNIRLWNIATVAAKDRIYSRLRIPPAPDGSPKPGYHHLPDWITDEYMRQLTSEQKIIERDKRTRRLRQRYVSVHSRNEALDLTVYAHGGLFILQNFIDPLTFRNLERLHQLVLQAGGQSAQMPVNTSLQQLRTGHRILSEGIKL
jgi:phage terminase large subunit GpA-like protein